MSNDTKDTAPSRVIRAVHNDETVRVYQAYNDSIADAVLKEQSFQTAMKSGIWSCKRMTWIKPSKLWMAYRCGWTVLKDSNQARVLALDLDRSKFEELLASAQNVHGHEPLPQHQKFQNSSVVIQWDPERVITLGKEGASVYTGRMSGIRSIQIGLRPPANECLLDPKTVVRIADVTQDFRAALKAIQDGRNLDEVESLLWPEGQVENVLPIPLHVATNIGMDMSS